MKNALLTILGAAVGGFVGYHAVFWVYSQGFYALVLPGGLLALGASLGRNRSVILALLCGVAATALGIYTEWRFYPFVADASLEYFVQHLHTVQPISLIMIALGGGLGFYVPYRQAMDWKAVSRVR